MLTKTFFHVPGLGIAGERHLWRQGCLSWQDFLENPNEFDIRNLSLEKVKDHILRSQDALHNNYYQFFEHALGPMLAWRAWPEFKRNCVYLDIETDGGSQGEAITMIGLFDGQEFQCLIREEKLDDFPQIIENFSMIVTFYGTAFDLPMIKKRFSTVSFDQIHLDLCPILKDLGYKGGLKKIERELGINRSQALAELKGYDAIKLWQGYQNGNDQSLKTLIDYNREDVVNLEALTQIAYNGHYAKVHQGIETHIH